MLKARSSPQTSRRMSASQGERAARGAKNVDNAALKNTKVGTAKTKEDKGMDELEFPECSAINAAVAASAKYKILCPATSATVKVEAREKLREEIAKMVSNVQMISGVVKSIRSEFRKNTGQRHTVCDRGSIAEVAKDNIKYHDPDRCYEIGHRASDCKNKRVSGNCGDEEHSFKECRARIKCCVLCERGNEFNKNSDAVKTNHDSRA
ncbi:hypothetical protein CBL_20407 [Carabus blaptoides fortunei]